MVDNNTNGFQETGVGMYDTYVPFQTGWAIETYGVQRCEYCGKPAKHANCHAHEKWCPYSCNQSNVPVGSEFTIIPILFVYLFYKIYNKIKK